MIKKILVFLFAYFCFGSITNAETIYTEQDNYLNGTTAGTGAAIPNATYLGVFSDNNPQWTNWIQVDTKRTACYDIALVDASAGITSVDFQCYVDQVNTGVVGSGYRLPVFVATSAAGVTSSRPSTIQQTSTAGLAPGTSNWSWCVTNIPGAWIMCSFFANGVITADVDTIAVRARGITP